MAASLLLGDVCVLKENISMNVPKDEAALAQEAAKSSLKLILQENKELGAELARIREGNLRAFGILATQQPPAPPDMPSQESMELAPSSPTQSQRETRSRSLGSAAN